MFKAQLPQVDLTHAGVWQQLLVSAPLCSSQTAGWQGIHLAHHRLPAHELPDCYFAQHVITICMGQFEVELKRGGRWQTEHYRLGDIGIFPAHQPHPQARCDRGVELIQLYLDPHLIAQVTDHSLEASADIVPQHKIRDPLIQQIGLTLKTELETGDVDSRCYADAMATALSAHLIQRYSTQRSLLREYTGGLSPHKLKQAIAYIQDHLDQDLRLAEIAASVQISPHYFATLFKQSTGLAPHQFVTQCRVERAKCLLTKRELTILEILLQLGFKSQSHFTRVFREQTGLTPTAYRNHP